MMRDKSFSIQLKPVGSECNIDCTYCYVEPFRGRFKSAMSDEVLEKTLKSLLAASESPSISWHGGEPMLAGIEFFRKALGFIEKHRQPEQVVRHMIQTNATAVTPEFALLLAENNFLVSVSLDGPEHIHGLHRVNRNGHNTYGLVMRGVDRLREAGLDPQVITTVTNQSAAYAEETFSFLVEQGYKMIKYSPVFDTGNGDFILDNEAWFDYLRRVFYEWLNLGDSTIQVRELDEVIAWIRKDTIKVCSCERTCLKWASVDPNGNLYPCEFLRTNISYGNVESLEIGKIASSEAYQYFSDLFSIIPAKCGACEFYNLCGNGCPSTRVDDQGSSPQIGVYAYCEQRKLLYEEIKSKFISIIGHDL